MDFFQYQDEARRKTRILVGYYILAVTLIIVAVYAVIVGVFSGLARNSGNSEFSFWDPGLFFGVVASTCTIVLLGSAYKISQLSKGGEAVASMLGGRPVDANTTDPDERKTLNVVEEMAIASGTPVPRLFILEEEPGINAFAAGFTTRDAVVGVTRGAISKLTRNELQGVIAHEFSHILNGDMRLNIRLMGILNGILVIGMIGFWTMRIFGSSRSRSSKDKGGLQALALAGLLIWIVGSIGIFFAKLIKSAVSRQREYLADASAVQFTRNPDGIARALRKIGGFSDGSRLLSEHAEEASHFLFSNGLGASFSSMMATHPPLEDRIRRIDPSFDGSFEELEPSRDDGPAPASMAVPPPLPPPARFNATPGSVLQKTGTVTPEHVSYAGTMLAALPAAVLAMARTTPGAELVAYALLLSPGDEIRAVQKSRLDAAAPGKFRQIEELTASMRAIDKSLRLPLMSVAISSLKSLSAGQYSAFKANIRILIDADSETDLFEYTVQRMIFRHLDPVFNHTRPPIAQYYSIKPLMPDCARLLSCIAYWGADDTTAAAAAFRAGAAVIEAELTMSPVTGCGLDTVDRALNSLSLASPAVKRTVLSACVACVAADGVIGREEAELIRAVADSFDCPLPPFLPGARAA